MHKLRFRLSARTLLLTVAVGLLSVLLVLLERSDSQRQRTYARVEGIVTNVDSQCTNNRRSGPSCAFFPSVSFYGDSGTEYHFRSSTGRGFRKLTEGQTVTVRYDAASREIWRTAYIEGYGVTPALVVKIIDYVAILLVALSVVQDSRSRSNNSFKPKPLRGSA